MFNNLIESTSHTKEYKRRGSFVLFTTATYVVFFVVTGVISIYAYDAHLESQNTELEILTFVPLQEPELTPEIVRNTIRPTTNPNNSGSRSVRTAPIDSVTNPINIPPDVGTVAPNVPPARPDSVLGATNEDPITPVSTSRGVSNGTGTTPLVNMPENPPPTVPNPVPSVPSVLKVSTGVLEGKATLLPKPIYPEMAKRIRVQGPVTVQVLIDEYGKVLSATIVSGHPLLVTEAKRAALQARFQPTKLSDQPVKVSGMITYNFELK